MVRKKLLGLCTISVGYVIAVYLNRKFEIPLRDAPDASIKDITALSNKEDKDLPPLIWAVLPALFPMVMICIRSYYEAFKTPGQPFSQQEWLTGLFDVVLFTGDKNIALFIGAIIALFTLLKYGNDGKRKQQVIFFQLKCHCLCQRHHQKNDRINKNRDGKKKTAWPVYHQCRIRYCRLPQ